MDNITVIPHQVNYVVPINKRIKTTNSLNIGLLGILTANKGLYIIESMLKIIEERHLDIRIILLGTTERTITSANFTQTGDMIKKALPI